MTGWKTVRVFISSTFRDMQAERDHLVRAVFPKLRQCLERHRVYLEDIDLRWGITKEQAENAETLDLCLRTIDDCRPFFLGIIGERYGTVLGKVSAAILQGRGLEAFAGASVTELEIVYGALIRHPLAPRAFFFLRDPGAISSIPPGRFATFVSQDEVSRHKLDDLKNRIRSSGCYVYDGYPAQWQGGTDGRLAGLEAFGDSVFNALWTAFAEELAFGAEDESVGAATSLDEADLHDRFMEARTRVFTGRSDELQKLRHYIEAPGARPCLVFGNSGLGKSALLARFALDLRVRRPNATVFTHFVGASDASADLGRMLARLCAAILPLIQPSQADAASRMFNDPDAIPSSLADVKARFKEFLGRATADRELVLVIDAIDQLHAETSVRTIDWLPAELGSVKVIVSCVDNAERGREIMDAFKQRGHSGIELTALKSADRIATIRDVPSLSAKSLDRAQIQLLASNPATASPLFLRTALEELRTFGSYEGLTQRIKDLPRPKTSFFGLKRDPDLSNPTRELFLQILERLEGEYGAAVMQRILGSIAVSRRGLLELEIAGLAEGLAAPEDVYSILRQLRPNLFPRSGALGFYHQEISAAVSEKYLTDREVMMPVLRRENLMHGDLAQFFITRGWRSIPREEWRGLAVARACEEAPWQLVRAGHFHAAADLLLEPEFLEAKGVSGLLPDLLEDFSRLLRATSEMPLKESITDERAFRAMRRMSGKETFTHDESNRFPRKRLMLIEQALRLHATFIKRHPHLLMQCLWNASWWFDCPVQTRYSDGLVPVMRNGGTAITSVSQWLDKWNAMRAESPQRAPLLRSLHPPPVPLVLNSRMIYGPDGPGRRDASPRFLTVLPGRRRVAAVVGDDDFLHGNTEEFRIWRPDTDEELGRIRFHEPISDLSLAADGGRLAVSINGKARLYDVPTGEVIWETDGGLTEVAAARGLKPVLLVALSGGSRSVAIAIEGDTTVRVFDITTRKFVAGFESAFPVSHLEFPVRAANLLVSGHFETMFLPGTHHPTLPTTMRDHRTVLWDVATGHPLFEIPREVVRYSADANRIILSAPGETVEDGSSNTEVRVLDETGGHRVSHPTALNLNTWVFALSEDGKTIASVSDGHGHVNTQIEFIDVESGQSIGSLDTMHSKKITSLAFLGTFDEDKALAQAGKGATQADALVETLFTAQQARYDQFVPAYVAEQKIVSASADGTIRVASFPGFVPRPALRPKGHRLRVNALCFSPDGTYLLSASVDATRIWRAADGVEVRTPGPGATAAAFFHSGANFVAAGEDGTIRIIGAEDGRVVADTKIAGRWIENIAVSHDGKLIAVADSENCVHILSGSNLAPVHVFPSSGLGVTAVDFHPHDDLLAITRADGRVHLIEGEEWRERTVFDITGRSKSPYGASAPPRTDEKYGAKFTLDGERLVAVYPLVRSTHIWALDGAPLGEYDAMLDPSVYGCRNYPWRIMLVLDGAGFDLVLASDANGKAIAHYPMLYSAQKFATHPSGLIFAAAYDSRLALFRLEDPPAAPDGEVTLAEAMEARVRADEAWRQGRTEDALVAVEQAVTLYLGVPQDYRFRAALELMRTLRGYAELLTALNRSDDAIARGNLAIEFGRVLINDEAYLAEVGNLCLAQSIRLDAANRCEESLVLNTEALGYLRRAAAVDLETHTQALATVLYHQGHRHLRLSRNESALEFFEEAETLLRAAAANAGDAGMYLAFCLNYKVGALQQLGRDVEALAASDEALQLTRSLFARDQEQHRELWRALYARWLATQRNGLADDAAAIESEMQTLCHGMHARGIAALSAQAALHLFSIANEKLAAGRVDEALALQSEGIAIYRARPDENRFTLADCLLARGTILGLQGRDEEAIAPLTESIELFRQHFSQNREECRSHLAHGLSRLSKRLSALDRDADSVIAAEEAVAWFRELLPVDPDTSRLRICESLNDVAWGWFKLGRFDDALAPSEEAAGLGRELITRDRAAFANLVANVLDTLGQIRCAMDRPGEAIASFQEALTLLDTEAVSSSDLNAELKKEITAQCAETLKAIGRTVDDVALRSSR